MSTNTFNSIAANYMYMLVDKLIKIKEKFCLPSGKSTHELKNTYLIIE